MDGRLRNKVAVVTGGGAGIGRAIVEAYAREGASLAIAELSAETGAEAARAVAALGQPALSVRTDVSQKVDIDAMVQVVIERFKRIDILVNNAGIRVGEDFLEVCEASFDRTIATNLKSQFFCAQAVARYMIEQGGGKIINIGSVSAEIADPGASVYCISKGGVTMLTKSLALELAPFNIQVNTIAPGTVKTALPWYDSPESVEYCQRFVPAKRFALPAEVAGAAIYLAASESDYVTGSTLTIDGGLMIQ